MPAKGAVSCSTSMFFEADAAVPAAELPVQMKEELICRLAQVCE